MFYALPTVLPLAAIAGVTKFRLMGKSLKQYDDPTRLTHHEKFDVNPNSQGLKDLNAYLIENYINASQKGDNKGELLTAKRKRFDQKGLDRDFGVTFQSDTASFGTVSVDGEWTLAEGCNPDRRILYIHGGAFMLGSAVSHRPITSALAKRTGCAVFAPNYRLVPENHRLACVQDVQAAYRWILNNGPKGPANVDTLAISGDSAGGNLTLVLSNWVRDENLRSPNAVAALSPATDSTFESPSLRGNYETDLMLQPLMGNYLKIPRAVLLWAAWYINKVLPTSPLISPVRDDLSNLPPTLIQASRQEMLYDDAKRYAAKAQSQGSPVRLQSWSHVAHVFQAFETLLPAASDGLDEIAKFFAEHGVKAN